MNEKDSTEEQTEKNIEKKIENEKKSDNNNIITNESILKEIEKYKESNYLELYKKNSFCDVKINERWVTGRINEIDTDSATITDYENPKNQTRVFLFDSENISYFRKYTKSNEYRRKCSRDDINNIQITKSFLENIIGFNFGDYDENSKNSEKYKSLKAYDMIINLRGKVYYWFDNVMNVNDNNEGIDLSIDIFELLLVLIKNYFTYLTKINDIVNKYQEAINNQLEDIVLIDIKYSIVSFRDDALKIYYKIMGQNCIYNDFYINYSSEIENIVINKYNSNIKKICNKKIYSGDINLFKVNENQNIPTIQLAYFIDFCKNIDFYQSISNFIVSNNNFKFDCIYEYIILFRKVNSFLEGSKNQLTNQLTIELTQIKNYIYNRTENLTENEVNSNTKDKIINLCISFIKILPYEEQNQSIIFEGMYLNYINACFKCNKLEKKIYAMNTYNSIIKSLDPSGNKISNAILNCSRDIYIKYLKLHTFAVILVNMKILDYILEENTHQELIKRSLPIINLLYIENFTLKDIEIESIIDKRIKIIDCLFNKLINIEKNDEIESKIIKDIISKLSLFLYEDDREYTYQLIKKYIIEREITKDNINLIKDYTINYLSNAKIEIVKDDNNNEMYFKDIPFNEKEFLGIQIIWDYLLDNNYKEKEFKNNLNIIEIIECCINALVEIFNLSSINDKLRDNILMKILNNINLNHSNVQSYFLLKSLLQNSRNSHRFNQRLQYIHKKNNIFDLIVDDLTSYFMKVDSIEKNSEDKNNINDFANTIFQGFYPHSINIEIRIELIFILLNKERNLEWNFNNFLVLWKCVNQQKFSKDVFFKILFNNINNLSYQFRSTLFKSIFLNEKLFVIEDLYSFNLFKKLMYEINISNGVFLLINKTELRINKTSNNEIIGLKKLWEVLINNKNNEVQNEVSSFLADICLNVKNPNSNEAITFWSNFISELIYYLNKSIGNDIKEQNNNNNQINELLNNQIPEKFYDKNENEEFKNEKEKEQFDIIKLPNIEENESEVKKLDEKKEEEKKEEEKKEEEKKEEEKKEKDSETTSEKNTNNTSQISENQKSEPNETGIKGLINLINKIYQKFGEKGKIATDLSNLSSNSDLTETKKYISFRFTNAFDKQKFRTNISYNEQFYILRYKISYTFDIPLNTIQFEYEYKSDNGTILSKKFDLTNDFDYFNQSIVGNKKYDPSQVLDITINIIENPIIEAKNNPKILLNSVGELYKILSELLKKKNKSYILDVWNLLKNDLDKNEELNLKMKNYIMDIHEDFKNDVDYIFDFENSSFYYQSYILSHLKYVLDKNKEFQLFLEQFVQSKIWNEKIVDVIKKYSVKISDEDMENCDVKEKIELLHTLDNFINIFKLLIPLEKEQINNLIVQKILQFINDIFYNAIKGEIKGDLYIAEFNSIEMLFQLMCNQTLFTKIIHNILEDEKEKELFINILIDGLILSKNNLIKEEFQKFIIKIYQDDLFEKENDLKISFSKFLLYFILSEETLNHLSEISKKEEKTSFDIFFEVCDNLIEKIYPLNIEFDYNKYVNKLLIPQILSKEPIKEELLSGFFLIIYSISKNIEITYDDIEGKKFDFAHYIFYDLLYNKCKEEPLLSNSIIIKNNNTFKNASNLLTFLIINDEKKRKEILTKLYQYNSLQFWKSSNYLDWKLSFEDDIKQNFVGLKNLGCTCYMNSLFQILFFIPSFRESLLNSECKEEQKNALYQLKNVFINLKYNNSQYFIPVDFTKNFDNTELNIREQMDIDEFFNLLIDKLENHLKGTNNENLIKYFFQGRNTDYLTFKENCNHHRKNDISFYSIQLQIMNKKNIYESLDSIIDGELMSDDNAIFCQECNKKIPAIKHQNFKILPRMLIFVLKRFQFNYNTMTKIKINDYYEFPIDLDMTNYTSDYLNNKDNFDKSKVNNMYKLKGIVVHSGNCEGGHYYSFIFDNNSNQWFEFNDSIVTKFNIENLEKETFGGFDIFVDKNNEKKIPKSRNAYLLFYEKVDKSNCENYDKVEIINEVSNVIKEKSIAKKVNQNIFHYHLEKIIFSIEYHRFILQFLTNLINLSFKDNQLLNYIPYFSRTKDENIVNKELLKIRKNAIGSNLINYINSKQIEIINKQKNINQQINLSEEFKLDDNISMSFQFLLLYFFNVLVRARDKNYLGGTIDLIKFCLNEFKECSEFLIEEFCDYTTLMEYIVNCPILEIKKVFVGLLYCAMIKIYNSETINFKLKNINDNQTSNSNIFENEKDNNLINNNIIDEELDDKPKTERQSRSIFSFFSALTSSTNKNLPPIEQNVINHLESTHIPKLLLKFINNVICLIKRINDDKNCMFLYYILYRFSLISPYTKDHLITKIPILTFLIYHLFPKYSERNIPDNFNLKVNIELINPEHNILAPMKSNEVGNIISKDNITFYIKENYIKLLLLNLMTGQRASLKLESCYDFNNYQFTVELFNGMENKQYAEILSYFINKSCHNDWGIVKKIIDIFMKIIDGNDFDKLDNVMLIFKRFIIDINDDKDMQISRVKSSLKQFFKIMNNNNKIYTHFDYCSKFIIGLFILNNEKMFEYIDYFHSYLEKIKNWYEDNKEISNMYTIGGMQMYKNQSNHRENINTNSKSFKDKITKNAIKIINIMENLNKKIVVPLDFEFDRFVDLTDFKFLTNDIITYCGKTAIIKEHLDELIEIKYIDISSSKSNIWIETDNTKIKLKELYEPDSNKKK